MTLRAVVACVIAFAAMSPAAAAQTVDWLSWTPTVLSAGAPETATIEVRFIGAPTRVNVEFSPAGTAARTVTLRDDGSSPDRAANDGIYSASLPSAPILAARTVDDVYRVFIGYLDAFNGTSRIFRGNLFADVYHEAIGTYPITRQSQFVQSTPFLVNIHDDTFFLTRNPALVAQEFYRWFGDDYDVLNFIYVPQRFANRTHSVIKNTVRGIGLAQANNSAAYGSAGRLIGMSQFPIAGFYDGAETGFIHELGHQWINFIAAAPFGSGVPHWPLSSMAGGVMGFSIGGQGGQGGSFRCSVREENGRIILDPQVDGPAYNDLDLYLMGLLPASEVGPQIVFADQLAANQLRCTGQTFTGAVTRVSADDVIAALGARQPPFGEAPTRFRTATILVTRDALAPDEMLWLYSWLTARAEWRARVPIHSGFLKEVSQPFYVATRGRGTLDVSIDTGHPDFSLLPAEGALTLPLGGTVMMTLDVLSRRVPFNASVSLSCDALPPGMRCAFDQATVSPGEAGRTVTLTLSASADAGTTPTPPGVFVVNVRGTSGPLTQSTAILVTVQ